MIVTHYLQVLGSLPPSRGCQQTGSVGCKRLRISHVELCFGHLGVFGSSFGVLESWAWKRRVEGNTKAIPCNSKPAINFHVVFPVEDHYLSRDLPPLKTNMTLENFHFQQEIHLHSWWFFLCHVSFRGGTINNSRGQFCFNGRLDLQGDICISK